MDYLLNNNGKGFKSMSPESVLNLIINGLPSKLPKMKLMPYFSPSVLNLIINGLPSKQHNHIK